MKNFDLNKFLMGVATVLVALTVFNIGKRELDKMRTKKPSIK